MNKNKNLGFTLAEVLIVIGIIGVVAALTLPNLNHATGDKERVTKVKKIYSALTEAFDRAQAIYGPFDTWYNDLKNSDGYVDSANVATASERFAKRVTEFMKISKDCGLEINQGCFTSGNSYRLDSVSYWSYDSSVGSYRVITADGMSLRFDNFNIDVDIDGPNKGPYMLGKDLFAFKINSQNNILEPQDSGPGGSQYLYIWLGAAAPKWILENDNADYLKADGSGKCNDSDIVLDWTTNTSCH